MRMKTENKHRNVMRTHAHQIKKNLQLIYWLPHKAIDSKWSHREVFSLLQFFLTIVKGKHFTANTRQWGDNLQRQENEFFFLTPCRYNPCFSAAYVSIKCDFRKSSGLLVSAVLPSIFLSPSLSFFRIPISTSQSVGYSAWGPPHPSRIIVPSRLITLLRKSGSVTHLPCCAGW